MHNLANKILEKERAIHTHTTGETEIRSRSLAPRQSLSLILFHELVHCASPSNIVQDYTEVGMSRPRTWEEEGAGSVSRDFKHALIKIRGSLSRTSLQKGECKRA